MEFAFTEEERVFQKTVRQFAAERLAPHSREWDAGVPFPRDLLKEYAKLGTLAIRVPERYGGLEAPFVMAGIACEETARSDFSTANFVFNHTIIAEAFKVASEELKAQYLPRTATGELIVAFGLTEPGVGSDAANITTRAERDGDEWVINGQKSGITFGGNGDICLLFARTGGPGARGVSLFVVPLDLPGVSRQVFPSPGETLVQWGAQFFDNVRIPLGNLVGEENKGFYQAMNAFDFNRALIALACIGSAEQSVEETIAYVQERHAFGKPLAKYEGVSFQIAEHLTRLEAARLLAYQTLWRRDHGLPHAKEAAMAKWFGQKTAFDAVHSCLLLHGHFGYSREMPYEMRMRDILGLEIGDGTAEIMKLIIAREAIGRIALPYR